MLASNLLERAFIELETEEWAEADKLLEQVLNVEPRNAQAYIGKLMVELRVSEESKLAEQTEPIGGYANFKKAVRFADDEKKAVYTGYNEAIQKRQEEVKQNALPLIERAMISLEFEEWDEATAVLNKALEIAPDNAQIYICKLMAELQVASESDLIKVSDSFEKNENYRKAVELATGAQKDTYLSYTARFRKRRETLHSGIWSILKKHYGKVRAGSDESISIWRFDEMNDTARAYYEKHIMPSRHYSDCQKAEFEESIIAVVFIEDFDSSKRSASYGDDSVKRFLIVTDKKYLSTFEGRSKFLKTFENCYIETGVFGSSEYTIFPNMRQVAEEMSALLDQLIAEGAATIFDHFDYRIIRRLVEEGTTDNIRNAAMSSWIKKIEAEEDVSILSSFANRSSTGKFNTAKITQAAKARLKELPASEEVQNVDPPAPVAKEMGTEEIRYCDDTDALVDLSIDGETEEIRNAAKARLAELREDDE